jgi:hypothetical protein
MSKKFISALLIIAVAMATVAITACKKEESRLDKGKADGAACCSCLKDAKDEMAQTRCALKIDLNELDGLMEILMVAEGSGNVDLSKLTDYQIGFIVAMMACQGEENEDNSDFEKGRKDAKAICDCIGGDEANEEACAEEFSAVLEAFGGKSNAYQSGFYIIFMECMDY